MTLEKKMFKVTGIHCEGCEQRIVRAISKLLGVHAVEPNHRTQQVDVTLNPAVTSVEEAGEKLGSLGFPCDGREGA